MIRLRHKLFVYALRVLDQGMLATSLVLVVSLHDGSGVMRVNEILRGQYEPHDALALLALVFGWSLCFNAMVRYETNRLRSLRVELFEVITGTAACAFLLAIIGALLALPRFTRDSVVIFWAIATTLSLGGRIAIRWLLGAARLSGRNSRRVLLIGERSWAISVAKRIGAHQVLGYHVVGIVESESELNADPDAQPLILGRVGDLQSILERYPVDEMIVCLRTNANVGTIGNAVRLGHELGIVVRLFPDADLSRLVTKMHIERFEDVHVVTWFREDLLLQLFLKRFLDVSLSLLLLILLSPVLLIVAIAIKLTSPGPVLFAQERVGMNRRRFQMYKFRSMCADAERRKGEVAHLNEMDGPVFKVKDDPRITPLGRWLRNTSIDELPQLFNVLAGHMSLVGPRPPLMDEVERYDWLFRKRLSIKPGVTCFWQISGRSDLSFERWMDLDRSYVDNWSLWLDVKILFRTVPAVMLRKGAR